MPRSYNNIPAYKSALKREMADQLERTGKQALRRIDEGFARGQSPTGEAWAPLAPPTIAGKGHSRILIEHGVLRDSFNASLTKRGDSHSLTVFSTDEKLKFHEFGTETMPKRPVMEPLGRWLDEDALGDNVRDALENAEERAGVNGRPL